MAISISYVRRCHVCGAVTERQKNEGDKGLSCESCGKAIAPFVFYVEKTIPLLADNLPRPPLLKGEFAPVRGLSVLW